MNDHSTTHSGSARALCSRCGRLVEMTRFVDPRLLDERPLEERLHEWDPTAGPLAAHALGLTPVVFILAGGLFALTAKTYAEGASMYPEAGGSSSFARHAFNEIASFFAGWALTLDYIITIAISAFFVPHYLSAFWPALHHNPGDIIGGAVTIAVLAALNIRGLRESANLNIFLAITDVLTQVLLVIVGLVLVFHPGTLVHQVHLGIAPTWTEVIFALSISMVAYTGIETVSNMAEQA